MNYTLQKPWCQPGTEASANDNVPQRWWTPGRRLSASLILGVVLASVMSPHAGCLSLAFYTFALGWRSA